MSVNGTPMSHRVRAVMAQLPDEFITPDVVRLVRGSSDDAPFVSRVLNWFCERGELVDTGVMRKHMSALGPRECKVYRKPPEGEQISPPLHPACRHEGVQALQNLMLGWQELRGPSMALSLWPERRRLALEAV